MYLWNKKLCHLAESVGYHQDVNCSLALLNEISMIPTIFMGWILRLEASPALKTLGFEHLIACDLLPYKLDLKVSKQELR